MKRLLPSSLRPRLMLLIGFTVSASMGLLFLSALRQERAAVGVASAEASLLSRLAAAHEERAITDARTRLGELARHDQIDPRAPRMSTRVLAEHLDEAPTLAVLTAATAKGIVFASTDPAVRAEDVHRSAWFRAALRRPGFVIEYEPARDKDGRAWLRCAQTVLDAKGNMTAVLCATLDASWLRRAADRARLPRETDLLVIDRHGDVVAQQPQSGRADSVVAGFRPQVSGDTQQLVRGGDGVWRIVAFSPLEGAHDRLLFVGVGIRRDAVLATARRTFLRDIALLLLFAIATAAATWRGVEVVVLRRVQALLEATTRLSHGDLAARTGLPYGHGELSQLSEDFDEMAASLERQRLIREQAEDRLRLSEARKRAVLEAALDAIIIADAEGRVLECNRAARLMFAIREPFASHVVTELVDLPRVGFGSVVGTLSAGRFDGEARRPDGSTFAAEVSIAPIRDPGADGLFVLTVRDITDRRRWEATLEAESHRDELTGLLNRRGFRALAQQQLKLAAREHRSVVLVSVDLDGLKAINDAYGHAEGDRAIVELGAALQDSFRDSDVIARLGGDEFVVFALESDHPGAEQTLDRLAVRLASRDAELEKPWRLSASFGWSRLTPTHDTELDSLLEEADHLMYIRKRRRGFARDAIAAPGLPAGPNPTTGGTPRAA